MREMQFYSPERWWRFATAPVIAGFAGWGFFASYGLFGWLIAGCVGAAVGGCPAALQLRSHLSVTAIGVADYRMFRVVRLPWRDIAHFQVQRPAGLRAGFCITALCHGGARVDLLSTQVYSRVPSARHLDELHRICGILEEAGRNRVG